MDFTSTRDHTIKVSLSTAIEEGLAEDGGLFVPTYFPSIKFSAIDRNISYPEFAATILQEFFVGDPLEKKLLSMCENAFNFPVPLRQLNDNTFILELFHGPTLSFKDFGARFLAECLMQINNPHKITVMVATSGDTGSAVASAFYLKRKIDVIILYPRGQITARQQQQITC